MNWKYGNSNKNNVTDYIYVFFHLFSEEFEVRPVVVVVVLLLVVWMWEE